MPKYLLGIAAGSITTGLALILSGRQFFPEISISYRVIWLVIAGALTGLSVGLTGHFTRNPGFLLSSVFFGAIIYGIFGVVLGANILYSLLLGTGLALATGWIVDTFGQNEWKQTSQ